MADNRLSTSPLSSSPGRLPAIARPDWPWAARAYGGLRSSQPSPHPLSHSTVHGSPLQSGWESRASYSSNSSQSGYFSSSQNRNIATPHRGASTSTMAIGDTTRHWTYTGFEWVVRDIQRLRDFIEGVSQSPSGEAGGVLLQDSDFEVLKQSPMLGDSKYKLEIAPTLSVDGSSASAPPTLSLYITSLMLDYQGDYEASASMMAAVKCLDNHVGERGGRPEWVWEYWQNDWTFRRESEVWDCPLPSLSSLLENQRIRSADSLVICVQIHCPIGPTIPQQPSAYYVPRDLLDGLEASLDNPNTGDVRFICLERLLNAESTSPDPTSSTGLVASPFGSYTTARKRIIYAHSDILTRRSDYFATMLSSSFSENSTVPAGERKLYTIVVEEADFETIYWLLKYCYANWLSFKQDDDPRIAVEGIGAGWSARWITAHKDEWDWKTFRKTNASEDSGNDARSATSADSIPMSTSVSRSTSNTSDVRVAVSTSPPPPPTTHARPGPLAKSSTAAVTPSKPATLSSSVKRSAPSTSSNPIPLNVNRAATSSNVSRTPKPPNPPSTTFTAPGHYPVSPRAGRHPAGNASPDPHPHPTPAPGPASALSIYQVAHRYAMPSLAAIALEHIMTTITPPSAFAFLLATSVWDELHSLVEDYVVDRWEEVSTSTEFEQCCKEVAAGEWGSEGGKTLMSVFRRLRSPNATAM